MFVATNHQYDVLYPKGKCFWMRVYEIPEEVKQPKVERFKILLISRDDKVKAFICTKI
jgi:hypothetical protein